MAVRIVVDNRVRVSTEGLPSEVEAELRAAFTHENPQFHRLQRMGFGWREEREIRTYQRESDGTLSFPRGGMSRVRSILQAHGIERETVDARTEGETLTDVIPDHQRTLYEHQARAVDALIARENALLRAATGIGKTTVAIAIAARLKLPTLVVVWESKLFDQWVRRAETELGLHTSEVGVIRGSTRRLRPLTIAMDATLRNVVDDELTGYFGVVIADEVQRFAAPTLFKCIDPFPARYRFGISADETRKDGKEFLVYDLFHDVACEIDREEAIATGTVMDVEVLVVPTEVEAPWYRGGKEFKRLLDAITADAARTQLAVDLVAEECAAGHQAIVFSHRVEHCFVIDSALSARGVRSGVSVGDAKYRARSNEALDGLRNGSVRAVVGTIGAIGQGIDVPSISVGCVVTPLAGNRQQFGQVIGRVCRTSEGKTAARLYYLWDRHVYGLKHLKNLIKWNRSVVVWDGSAWVDAASWIARVSPRRRAVA